MYNLYEFYLKSATHKWKTKTGYVAYSCFWTRIKSELDGFLTCMNHQMSDFYKDCYLILGLRVNPFLFDKYQLWPLAPIFLVCANRKCHLFERHDNFWPMHSSVYQTIEPWKINMKFGTPVSYNMNFWQMDIICAWVYFLVLKEPNDLWSNYKANLYSSYS